MPLSFTPNQRLTITELTDSARTDLLGLPVLLAVKIVVRVRTPVLMNTWLLLPQHCRDVILHVRHNARRVNQLLVLCHTRSPIVCNTVTLQQQGGTITLQQQCRRSTPQQQCRTTTLQ